MTTAGDIALGIMFGRAIKDVMVIAPELHITIFSNAELDTLESDLVEAISAQEKLLQFVRDRRQRRVLDRQEMEEREGIQP